MNYKSDFPIFEKRPELIYFDNGASSQKPKCVIDAISEFYSTSNSNIHRGPHFLAEEATIQFENSRRVVADFIGAQHAHEVIFTKNATEAINMVAESYGSMLNDGDAVVLTKLDHHANIVPWLKLKQQKNIELRYLEFDKEGRIVFNPDIFDSKVRFVSVSGMSNVFGTITDLKPIITAAREVNAPILVDAAQLAVHQQINVHQLDVDFLVLTGHKLYGPTGIGVLYGKESLLNLMPPFIVGGDMVSEVYENEYSPAELPNKFEGGTPNVAGAIGLKAAIDYILKVGQDKIHKAEKELTDYLLLKMSELDFIQIIGPTDNKNRGSIVAFTMTGVHPHDIAEIMSQNNICIRAGQHCTQILHDGLGIPASARFSLAFYNTKDEIDKAVEVLREIYELFN